MKIKTLLTIILMSYMMNVCSQTKVFVIFTSNHSNTKGVWNSPFTGTANDRDTPHFFTLFDRAGGNKSEQYFYEFIYENLKEADNKPSFWCQSSFFSGETIIDWDLITSKNEAELKYRQILSYNEIYFIDRNETKDSSYKVYPVKLFKLNY